MDEQLKDLLNNFQHFFMPKALFNENQDLIAELSESSDLIYVLFNDICVQIERDNPFEEEEFFVKKYQMANDCMVFHLGFPKPEEPPLCWWMYLFFDRKGGSRNCYGVERTDPPESGDPGREYGKLVCLDKKDKRIKLGIFPVDRPYEPLEAAFDHYTASLEEAAKK